MVKKLCDFCSLYAVDENSKIEVPETHVLLTISFGGLPLAMPHFEDNAKICQSCLNEVKAIVYEAEKKLDVIFHHYKQHKQSKPTPPAARLIRESKSEPEPMPPIIDDFPKEAIESFIVTERVIPEKAAKSLFREFCKSKDFMKVEAGEIVAENGHEFVLFVYLYKDGKDLNDFRVNGRLLEMYLGYRVIVKRTSINRESASSFYCSFSKEDLRDPDAITRKEYSGYTHKEAAQKFIGATAGSIYVRELLPNGFGNITEVVLSCPAEERNWCECYGGSGTPTLYIKGQTPKICAENYVRELEDIDVDMIPPEGMVVTVEQKGMATMKFNVVFEVKKSIKSEEIGEP
jgi:hypothetical protein